MLAQEHFAGGVLQITVASAFFIKVHFDGTIGQNIANLYIVRC